MNKLLREWAPLTDLFNKLPTKIQNGIFTSDLKLTCIDVLPEFIALGTNFGLVYWYDRKKKTLQKLRCENSHASTTFVKVVSTVDFMVACGNKCGCISIFQIPKTPSETLPENLKPKNKQIERYTVSDLHRSPITALEWSKNGMKLFSGDKSGKIVLTELDFYMHLCKSLEILNESYEIIQLNYYQQILLVSTTYRSIICKRDDKWKVSQVGKKDRKVLGNFGGIIKPNTQCPYDAVIYCTRPGLRIWESDLEGNVLQTLVFKDILTQPTAEIEVVNPISENLRRNKPRKETTFGTVLQLNDESLIIYNNDNLFVLNPKMQTIEAVLNNLRNILSVAVTKNEVFVLEGERSLIRLAYFPETNESADVIPQHSSIPTANNAFLPISASIKELTSKLQQTVTITPLLLETVISNGRKEKKDLVTENLVTKAEEARESPRRMQPNVPEISDNNLTEKINETYKKLERINEAVKNDTSSKENETILFKQNRRNKSKENDIKTKEVERTVIGIPEVMTMSTVGILPDLRSSEDIKCEIEEKERLLADILCLDVVKLTENKPEIDTKKGSNVRNDKISLNGRFLEDADEMIFEISKQNFPFIRKQEEDDSKNKKIGIAGINSSNKEFNVKEEKNEVLNEPKEKIKLKRTVANNVVPELVKIPKDWKLNRVHVKDEEEISSDTSLADWELL